MERLGKVLEQVYRVNNNDQMSGAQVNGRGDESRGEQETTQDSVAMPQQILARVNTVASDSPAQQAGIQPGDLIVRFGDVVGQSEGTATLRTIGDLVSRSEGVSLTYALL